MLQRSSLRTVGRRMATGTSRAAPHATEPDTNASRCVAEGGLWLTVRWGELRSGRRGARVR